MLELLEPSPLLLPVVALVLWTLVVQTWMVITRLPAMAEANIDPQSTPRTSDLAAMLPDKVMWKADNYNHLMEQPTIFYALVLALAIGGFDEGVNLWMAWFYVGSRVAHSLVHATINKVTVRFSLFSLGTLAILVMSVNGAMQLLG